MSVRILFLGNNRLGERALRWLVARGETIAGVVVHPAERRRFPAAMLDEVGLAPSDVLEAPALATDEGLRWVRDRAPEIGVSVLFGYILRAPLLGLLPAGCVNLHPAFLPYNRGAHPNVWSIIERTPAGATLHYIDSGVDTGDVVAQVEVAVEPRDTGESLYRRLEQASFELFCEWWPRVADGSAPRRPQPAGGTHHRVKDVDAIDRIDSDATYTARQLIDILRARTFPPYRGAYIESGGRRTYLRLQLLDESELE